jgi:hypothetical protein
MMIATFRRHLAMLVLSMMLFPCTSYAQGRSHGYLSIGAGATDLDWGLDWLIPRTPIGIGAEMGPGNLIVLSFEGSYHPSAHQTPSKLDPFATLGFMMVGSSEFSARGMNVGGGMTYWPLRRLGLRLDGFKFLPLATHYDVRPEDRSTGRYWGVRAGVAVHFG